MPIVEVEIVLREGEKLKKDLAASLADHIGEIFGSPPGNTWVKLRALPIQNYAENAQSSAAPIYPVFVSVLKADPMPADEMEVEIKHLTRTIARACNRHEENIHIIYLPSGSGRVAFGGKMLPNT